MASMDYSFKIYLWLFVIYAFLGWWIEVSFHAVTEGKFVNRGFLNGPVCPIYGIGMLILLYFLYPLVNNLILLFIGSVILTSGLEFVTGFILEKVFDDKWWDYSDMPFNIKGYICLSFSIMWGLASVFVIEIIHPSIFTLISIFDNKMGNIIITLIVVYFLADFIVTIVGILGINKRFYLLEEMASRLRLYSNVIGEDIYERVNTIMDPTDKEIKDPLEMGIDIEELKEKCIKLKEEKTFVHKRIEKAYPNIKRKLSKYEEERKEEKSMEGSSNFLEK